MSTYSNLKVLICFLTFSYRHVLLSNPKGDNCVLHKKTVWGFLKVWLQGVVNNDIKVLMKHTIFSGFFKIGLLEITCNCCLKNNSFFKKTVKCVSYTCVTS